MTFNSSTGYLNSGYLNQSYLAGHGQGGAGWQALQATEDATAWQGLQSLGHPEGWQGDQIVGVETPTGFEGLELITASPSYGWQSPSVINDSSDIGFQASVTINTTSPSGWQSQMVIEALHEVGFETKRTQPIAHATCGGTGYLATPNFVLVGVASGDGGGPNPERITITGLNNNTAIYIGDRVLVDDYTGLVTSINVVGGYIEVSPNIGAPTNFTNADITIESIGRGYLTYPYLEQKLCAAMGWQATQLKAAAYGWQGTQVQYNTNRIRIMCDFPSRGASVEGGGNNAWGQTIGTGLNWEANSTATSPTSDFDVNNVNTDIVEQVWRGADAGLVNIFLKCDTEIAQGITVDTVGIFNHNLTTSAVINLEGSLNSSFAPLNNSISLTVDASRNDIIHVEPTFPEVASRYWRIAITDTTNPDNYLQIGTVVFGNAVIFLEECMVDRISKTPVNFTDGIRTEAHTFVKNDRGIKTKTNLTFRNLNFSGVDFTNLDELLNEARTMLKCLWIPTPEFPQRFSTFAKISKMPTQKHNVKGENLDFVDLNIDLDESL